MSEHKEILKKLFEVQKSLVCPKSLFNNFAKYSYRSCESILEALKPVLSANNCVVKISDEIVNISERFYVKATVVLICVDSGESIECCAFAREEENKKGQDSSQITGATSSYARKYALNGLFAIDDTKDADNTNKHEAGASTPKNEGLSGTHQEVIGLAKALFVDPKSFEEWLHARFQETKVKDMSESKAKMALSLLADMKAAKEGE